MPKKVIARQGDSIPSLAHQNGHFWETVWNDGGNADLKQKRPSPNQLAPGDVVEIPDLRRKDESGATEQRHRFKRKGVPSILRLQLKTLGEPRPNEKYVLELDGELIEGTTDGEGKLEQPIPPDCKGGRLLLNEGAEVIPVKIGHLDPVDVVSGTAKRLANLGYDVGNVTNWNNPALKSALEAFQRAQKLDVTGKADDATKAKLLELHP
jgi:N-acetylmuramoyl-L-alanine amidase